MIKLGNKHYSFNLIKEILVVNCDDFFLLLSPEVTN